MLVNELDKCVVDTEENRNSHILVLSVSTGYEALYSGGGNNMALSLNHGSEGCQNKVRVIQSEGAENGRRIQHVLKATFFNDD